MQIPWADLLTSLRIFLILPITGFVSTDRWGWVLALYLLIPLTDLFDGYLARRTEGPTLGPKFDAIADILFGLAIICLVYWKSPDLRPLLDVYLPLLITVGLLFFLVSYLRTREILLLHLWTGKLTGWTGYLWFILTFYLDSGPWATHAAMLVTIAFYLECIVFVLKGQTSEDARSAFF